MAALEKISAREAAGDALRCSFCGNRPAEDSALIAAAEADVFICDECLAAGSDLLTRDDRGAEAPEANREQPRDDATDAMATKTYFRLLTEADIARLITMDELIDAMQEALRRFSGGDVVQPVRAVLPVNGGRDVFALMPSYVREPALLGAKLVTVFPQNGDLQLPTHLAAILLFSPETGALRAVLDGRYITEVRTAAVSAVSANLLARDDAAVLAILGSGAQARSHLHALDRVFELSDVRVWSPTPEHQEAFVDEMRTSTKATLAGAASAAEAVRDADLVVLATSSAEPVVRSDWIKPGAHVMSVGACRPTQREMDPELLRRGRLYVDSKAAALVESGDVVMAIKEGRIAESHIVGELGALVAGKVEGRRWPQDVTIFKSLGLAVEDVVAADLAYRRALIEDAGRELEL
jgi:alanine dehydrogenase